MAGTTGGSTTSGEPSNNTSGSTAITIAQMPAHNHGSKSLTGSVSYRRDNSNSVTMTDASGVMSITQSNKGPWPAAGRGSTSQKGDTLNLNATHTHTTQGSGEGHTHTLSSHTHETMPPYLAVYVW